MKWTKYRREYEMDELLLLKVIVKLVIVEVASMSTVLRTAGKI